MDYSSPAYRDALLQRLKQLYDKGQLCDFSLVVDGAEVKLHSVVLFSASAYFKMLMDEGLLKEQRFCLQNSSLESLQILVNFMYTGCLMLSENNILITLALATQLDIPEAIDLCQQFLQDIARKTHNGTLSSIRNKLPPDIEASMDLAIKQEVNDLKVDDCDEYDMSLSWNNECSVDYKLTSGSRKYQKHGTNSSELQIRNMPLYREKSDKVIRQTLNQSGMLSELPPDRNRCLHQNKEDLPLLPVTDEGNKCCVCVVCNKNFLLYSTKVFHQRSHWSVLYADLQVKHIIAQSKCNTVYMENDQPQCASCFETFPHVSAYRAHLLTAHRNQLYKYRCRKCPSTRFQYRKHLCLHNFFQHRTNYCSKSVKCSMCTRHFLYERSLLLHKCSVHQVSGRFANARSSIRQKKQNYVTHDSITAAKWMCEEKNCQCTFSTKNKLIEHITKAHPQVNYTCPMNRCKFSTKIRLMLDRHCKKFHDTSCSNVCDVCGKIFQRAFRLKIHLFSRHRIKDPDLTVS